jgi:DNA-directed RNA polymerase subunit K/omega
MAREAAIQGRKNTKYEIARMLGARALQIAMGAPFLVKLSEDELGKIGYNPIEIARIEYERGALPIEVRRPAPRKLEEQAPPAAPAA